MIHATQGGRDLIVADGGDDMPVMESAASFGISERAEAAPIETVTRVESQWARRASPASPKIPPQVILLRIRVRSMEGTAPVSSRGIIVSIAAEVRLPAVRLPLPT